MNNTKEPKEECGKMTVDFRGENKHPCPITRPCWKHEVKKEEWEDELEAIIGYLEIPEILKAGSRAYLKSFIKDLLSHQSQETEKRIRESVIREAKLCVCKGWKEVKGGEPFDKICVKCDGFLLKALKRKDEVLKLLDTKE